MFGNARRPCFAMLKAINDHAQGERLNPRASLRSRVAVGQHSWELRNFCYPAAVRLLFLGDAKLHGLGGGPRHEAIVPEDGWLRQWASPSQGLRSVGAASTSPIRLLALSCFMRLNQGTSIAKRSCL